VPVPTTSRLTPAVRPEDHPGTRMKLKLRGRRPRPKAFAVLPTLLTLANAVCGFGAIAFASGWAGYEPATAQFVAGCLILLAMLFDGLDGAAARWAGQTSRFGAELDSLCDAISFGAAPAFVMLALAKFEQVGIPSRLLFVAASLYVVGAVLRLARFNVEPPPAPEVAAEEKAKGFTGLPSPAAASVVASFPIALFGPQLVSDAEVSASAALMDLWAARLLPLVTFGVALLMVSRVRYAHLFKQLLRRGRNRYVNTALLEEAANVLHRVVRLAGVHVSLRRFLHFEALPEEIEIGVLIVRGHVTRFGAFVLHQLRRNFFQEARRHRRLRWPPAKATPEARPANGQLLLRARHGHVAEAPFLFHGVVIDQAALVREEALFDTGNEDERELEALAVVDCQQADARFAVERVAVGD